MSTSNSEQTEKRRMERFFPRGRGVLISILIPTRKKPRDLLKAIDSCASLAGNPYWLEFVIRIDDDDKATIDIVNTLKETSSLNIKPIICPAGLGYTDLHLMYNEMAAASSGDWLFHWDEHARMETSNWDNFVHYVVPTTSSPGIFDICVLFPRKCKWMFPIMRRMMFEILGHTSQHFMIDFYTSTLMNMLQKAVMISLDITHPMVDLAEEYVDFFRPLHSQLTVNQQYRKNLIEDLEKLHEYFTIKEKEAVYHTRPSSGPGWYFCLFPNGHNEPVLFTDDGWINTVSNRKIGTEDLKSLRWSKIY